MTASSMPHAFAGDVQFGYLDRTWQAPRVHHPQLIVNTPPNTMLRAIRDELRRASSFLFSVAFVTPRAIALLKQELVEFEGPGVIVTSDYLGFNSPAAFHELLGLRRLGIDVRRHTSAQFHPKGYVFRGPDGVTALLGSSNLTETALVTNHEWNIRVSAAYESDLADQFINLMDRQFAESVPLTEGWVDDYTKAYVPPARTAPAPPAVAVESQPTTLTPNAMQSDALTALEGVRAMGQKRALVISATGTGKTILSALHVREVNPTRMLFVVHREQILDRAIHEFQRVLGGPSGDFGKLSGGSRETNRRYLFATIQTLTRPDVLAIFRPDEFDYILIDEVHRAGAESYRRVIDHFDPAFLLGMTATPERTDGFNVFELFDFNVPFEIRLNAALEQDMLAPFHYYGVTDVTFEDGHTTSEATPLARLVSRERVDHVLRALETYGQAGERPRGLIFCSRNEEASELSVLLNQRELRGSRLRTVALSGADPVERREHVVEQLERGEVDYILTVDIFNEGVDIPCINQVVMLRQTQSSIVFVQQLGRGLRKANNKEYLVVIDFIGNYANNYLIPVALFGDDSLNKESLRKNLIAAEERGYLSGLSSIRFDRIAQERVLSSLATSKLDSLHNLKSAVDLLRSRLGRLPSLNDFLRFESADPVLVATKEKSYPTLLSRLYKEYHHGLTDVQLRFLAFLSKEGLAAKRVHELLTIDALLRHSTRTVDELSARFAEFGVPAGRDYVMSALRTFTLEFNTEPELNAYGVEPLVTRDGAQTRLSDDFAEAYVRNPEFAGHVDDAISTGLSVLAERYDADRPFTPGRQYSRKDASRLLNWQGNYGSTIYGYRVDKETRTCPIFVTYHKDEGVSASTAYQDRLLDQSTFLWYTRSRRTLDSAEVRAIVDNDVTLHVFAKKDDADGPDFYYLGQATSQDPEQTTMPDDSGKPLPVVRMHLKFAERIDSTLFDYFHPTLTQ